MLCKLRRSLSLALFLGSSPLLSAQCITEVSYLERPHFKIQTGSATYLYDMAGGGFSSIRDRTGVEWIGYKPGDARVPQSAAADFRGLPNLVFGGEDNGCGHPGFDKCVSQRLAADRILTRSKSGKWIWQWTFSESGARLEISRTDSSRNYWFLYEGIPGGSFDPEKQFWGTDTDGHRSDTPPIGSDSTGSGNWKWACFGHGKIKRCFYVVHLTPDDKRDNFSYMGSGPEGVASSDGMVVFGLGRDGVSPLLNGPNSFFIGFMDYDAPHEELPGLLEKHISQLIFVPE